MARVLHIGKKAPKGMKELPGAMHLGNGIWLIPCEPEPKTEAEAGGACKPQ